MKQYKNRVLPAPREPLSKTFLHNGSFKAGEVFPVSVAVLKSVNQSNWDDKENGLTYHFDVYSGVEGQKGRTVKKTEIILTSAAVEQASVSLGKTGEVKKMDDEDNKDPINIFLVWNESQFKTADRTRKNIQASDVDRGRYLGKLNYFLANREEQQAPQFGGSPEIIRN